MSCTPRPCLDAALRCAARGWPVLPCKPHGKEPLIRHGVLDATTTKAQIVKWWDRWPDANVAVRTGTPGPFVIDVDDPDAIAGLSLPPTAYVLTGRGFHFYFVAPRPELPSSAGRLARGVDTRGRNGFVLIPPSVHSSGALYRVDPTAPRKLAELPAAVVARLRPPPAPPPKPIDLRGSSADYGQVALEDECAIVANARAPGRNEALNRAAFKLGQLAGAGVLDERVAREDLAAAGTACGLGEREIAKTINSGFRGGLAKPRTIRLRSA